MEQVLNYLRGYSFGKSTYPNGGVFGPILRPYAALLLVEEGCCTMRTEYGTVRVDSGQTGIAVANERFEFLYLQGQSTTAIWCEGFLPKLQRTEFDSMYSAHEPIVTSPRLAQLQQIGLEVGQASSPDLNAMRDALGHAVYRAFLFEARQTDDDRKVPTVILRARRYIRESLSDETLEVSEIAKHAGITPQHLIYAFKKHIGSTPSRYLWRLRASTARQLLVHSPLTQSEIAFRCGYKSMPHFSRTIKTMYGMTPGELRRDMGFTRPSDSEDSVIDILY